MLSISPKNLFLIDALGALISAIMLAVVLVQFEPFFGMPKMTLYYLGAIAGGFVGNSLAGYIRFPKGWRTHLKAIAIFNLLYCAATLGLLFYEYEQLTVWGIAYFAGEILLVITLAIWEWKVAREATATA